MNRSRHDFAVRVGGAEVFTGEPIAIIGAACRLPGAPTFDAFRDLLLAGTDAVTEIPDERWNKAQLFHPERGHRGKAYTFAAGVIGDVKGFDPAFFGLGSLGFPAVGRVASALGEAADRPRLDGLMAVWQGASGQ